MGHREMRFLCGLENIFIINSYLLKISFASHKVAQPLFDGYFDKFKGGRKNMKAGLERWHNW